MQRNVTKQIVYISSDEGIFIHFFHKRHTNRNKKKLYALVLWVENAALKIVMGTTILLRK